ncbi:hypothetical protein, partial [Mesorhizobium sp. M2C.T.Ca.TU.002.02.1.1]|uniref:hypothetical protein n=1 Tax=Mesorhizobium sp. M2C.T.Ca.TU.002.02.1.1 TaxID=2496788 RepID=UPI000FD30C80
MNKELLALLRGAPGADAFSDKGTSAGDLAAAARVLLDEIAAAVSSGKRWHHHTMFPEPIRRQMADLRRDRRRRLVVWPRYSGWSRPRPRPTVLVNSAAVSVPANHMSSIRDIG